MSVIVDLKENQIYSELNFKTKEEVLCFLADELFKKGVVQEGYLKAILKREKEYPTGLPSPGVNIAIPHADHELVNKTTIIIGILKKPVIFYSMEDGHTPLKIQLVIMLAIAEPKGQIEMLQRIISIIQDESLTKKIISSVSKKEIVALLKPILEK